MNNKILIDRMLEYINIREAILNKERIINSVSITDLSFNAQLWELGRMREFIISLLKDHEILTELLTEVRALEDDE